MKLPSLISITIFLLIVQPLYSQKFKVSYIEVFGNKKIKSDDVINKLEIKENDSLDFEKFIPKIPLIKSELGAVAADMGLICCDDNGHYMLFLGVVEDSSHVIKYRARPKDDLHLPKQLVEDYNQFMSRLSDAVQKGETVEDRSKGHALSNYPPLQEIQARFEFYADKNLSDMSKVLKFSKHDGDRIAAAHIIAYASDKTKIVEDLLYAVEDSEESVRNNATRALALIASYSLDRPGLKIKIPADPFIKMVNSHVWTDRNKALAVLDPLTSKRDPVILNSLKRSAIPALVQMSKWRSKGHAEMAFILLGRLAGLDDKTIFEKWQTITPGQIDDLGAAIK